MNYKACCSCGSILEVFESDSVTDSRDTAEAKRIRFDAKVDRWNARHSECMAYWKELVAMKLAKET